MKRQIILHLDVEAYYSKYVKIIKFRQNGWSSNVKCPFGHHREKSGSFGFNRNNGNFKCFGCGEKGNVFKFEQLIANVTEKEAISNLAKKAGVGLSTSKLEQRVDSYHYNLLQNRDGSLDSLEKMGISKDIAIKNRLGYMPKWGKSDSRLVFPVFDSNGNIYTLKKYSRIADKKYKSLFEKGGKVSLYGIEQVKNSGNKIVLCAGEKDKNVAESILGDEYTFVTFTGGEGSLPKGKMWSDAVNALDKRDVVICYDADKAGIEGAWKVANALKFTTRNVKIVDWPKEFVCEYPKGDITDYLVHYGKKKDDLKSIIENAIPYCQESNTIEDTDTTDNIRRCENIIEDSLGYIKLGKNNQETYISNFIIVPEERIWIDDKETVRARLLSSKNSCEIVLERDVWVSKFNLLKEIKSIDMSFRGSDADLQCIQQIVASYDVSTRKGTKQIGYFKDAKETLFVLPQETITKKDAKSNTSFVPLKEQHPLQNHIQPKILPPETQDVFLKELFTLLPNLHDPKPLSIFLGWLFATPFKPQIMAKLHHFPLLNVFGTRGSGKSSLTALLWRLLGFSGEMFSCTQREFAWLKMLSSTNCMPIFADEYKPCDMTIRQVEQVQRLMRRLYGGEIEVKGKADQTLIQYHLQAPFGILGEVSFSEPAILERILPVPLSFRHITEQHRKNYQKMSTMPLQSFLSIYLQWVIEQNIDEIINSSQIELQQIIANCDLTVSERVKDNILVAIFGINCLQKFAQDHNLPIPSFCKKELTLLCIEEVCENVKGGKLAIDNLLEKLAYLAERKEIEPIYYFLEKDKSDKREKLYLRIKETIPIAKKWAKTTADTEEILDWKAYRQMLKERIGDYVTDISKATWHNGRTTRFVEIDIDKARKFGIDIEGFCTKENRV